MALFTLKNQTASGNILEASFIPEKGMNMISCKLGDIEIIDQSTKELFEKKFAGLGALIGPHFHRRPLHLIPQVDEKAFPHSVYFKNDPLPDPFSHGVARYAPWKAHYDETHFKASLSGKDLWNDAPLSQLEGQNFHMTFNGNLKSEGLELELSVVSDTDSLVGLHYYYGLPQGKGRILTKVQNAYIIDNEKKTLPADWQFGSDHNLIYPLDKETDFTFFPYPDPLEGKIILDTECYQVIITYFSNSAENSWQLWHRKGDSFVCIEPLSAQDPRHPNLTVSSLRINIQINQKNHPC